MRVWASGWSAAFQAVPGEFDSRYPLHSTPLSLRWQERLFHAGIAQSVEQPFCKRQAVSSILAASTSY